MLKKKEKEKKMQVWRHSSMPVLLRKKLVSPCICLLGEPQAVERAHLEKSQGPQHLKTNRRGFGRPL